VSEQSPTEKKKPCWNDWQFQMDDLFDRGDHEIDSWMLEFLVALLDEDCVAADLSIPLRQRDSAVPRLGKALELDSRVWMRLERLPEESKLELQHVESGLILAPQDLGTGISQVIPVIVAALSDPSGQASRLVMIEEPEANIHPAFQVVLADLFLTQVKANPDVLFLVETHSEHLMLRCLRRIRETAKGAVPDGIPAVSPKDVAVHFVEATRQGPRIKRIEIDEEGDFVDDWPGGFFEESFREKFAGR
jgi:predicted ATPase